MRVHSVCGYRSKSDEWADKWSDVDYRARNLVKALKREPFKGYSEWQAKATKQRWTVNDTPSGQAIALRVALSKLLDLLSAAGIDVARVVPVPSSRTIAAGTDFTGARLATALAGIVPGLTACPVLYFDAVKPKTADNGSRRWQDILPHLRGDAPIGAGRVILLDDVMTSGGHLRACARYLAQKGELIEDAFVVGRTVWAKPDSMFSMPVEDLVI